MNKYSRRTYKIELVTYTSKIILLVLFVLICDKTVIRMERLDGLYENLALWNATQNLYILNETYLPSNYIDLVSENEHNTKIHKVYKDLSDSGKIFLMNTLNYEHAIPSTDNEDDYNYYVNATNEEELYSYMGKNIMVDTNYLKIHSVKTNTNKNVLECLDNDVNTINLLVPIKYKEHEEFIKATFLEWFYFASVEVPNIYREAEKQPLIEKNKGELTVNIVYIQNNQQYFTYNIYSGNSMNIIEDPLITVYTDNIDNSFLSTCLGYCIYIQANDQYSVLKEINAVTNKYNVPELNKLSSVYDQIETVIRDLNNSIYDLGRSLIILLILQIIILVFISYENHFNHKNEIIDKSLYGHSFFSTYKGIVVVNIFTDVLVLPTIMIIKKSISFHDVIMIISFSAVDYFISRTIFYFFPKRHNEVYKRSRK